MMKRRIVCFCLCILLFISTTVHSMSLYYDGAVHQHDEVITLKINGTPLSFDVPPVIIHDRTLVPSRGLFEQLGATVEWKNNTRQVVITSDDVEIILTVDAAAAKINGEVVMMDVPAKIINDRTMIPVRFVSEHLGLSVGWEQSTKTVSVDQICNYTITDILYNTKQHRITVKADAPIVNAKDLVLEETRIVINFPDAKVFGGSGKLNGESEQLKEIRWAQYRTIPYIGRLVVELEEQTEYHISYSEDQRELYLDVKVTEITTPVPSPVQSPPPVTSTPKPVPTPSSQPDSTPEPTPTPIPFVAPPVSATVLNEAAKELLVVIDPGHGGTDVGAVGRDSGGETYEKDINLSIANKANALMKSAGVKTYMTRSTDVAVDLFERPEIANRMNATLFLSVHNNSFTNSEAHGTTVLYYPDGNPTMDHKMTSYRFSYLLQEELVSALGRYDRGLTDGAEMVVIRKTIAPSVITEIAFISNPTELALMKTEDFQNKAAEALCRAVIRALNEMTS